MTPKRGDDAERAAVHVGSRFSRKDYWCILFYVSVAVATGFADLRMRAYPKHPVTKFIPAVVANTEPAPARYRVLAPYLDYQVARVTGVSPQTVWHITRLLWIFLAYCVIHVYLRTWFAPEAAVAGVLLTAATLPLTFTNSWAHPDHLPELALFTLGALAIARRSDLLFAAALAVAALNRETSVFLVLLYAVAGPVTRIRVVRAGIFGLEWFAIYGGLRLWRGFEHYQYWQAGRNLTDLTIPLPAELYDPYYRGYAYFAVVLFGPMLYIAVRASGHAPLFVRRALLVVPGVVAVAFMFSNIIETRIFTPLYALILPGLMFGLFNHPPVNALLTPRPGRLVNDEGVASRNDVVGDRDSMDLGEPR
jgi:hypothetical protein